MKLALAQINPVVGDLAGNTKKIIDNITRAKALNADLVIFPELSVTGYPPEDLLLKPQFVADNIKALDEIVRASKGIAVCVGFVNRDKSGIYNSAAFINDRRLLGIYNKINLPNYSVFDEKRYFKEGEKALTVKLSGKKIGLGICEDIWSKKGPYLKEAKAGAKIIININASPYHIGKIKERETMLKQRAKQLKAALVYVNMVGGQDDLVFDGGSMVVSATGNIIANALQYEEDLLVVDLKEKTEAGKWFEELKEIYEALVLGVRDYVWKNNFVDVVIGLSGGIDSALTLTIAADALGPEHVHAVFMPSQYTSEQSYNDSKELSQNLNIDMKSIPIKNIFALYLSEITPYFKGRDADIAEENLQARIRGNILMAFSNKFNWLVLTTGNKSETSTGYCTLYGDMAGGYNVLKDVPKTLVYRLTKWKNKKNYVIPKSVILRAPTAELKPNQKDVDSLPPYELLDPIIREYVENNKNLKQIIEMGFAEDVVKKVASLIDHSEYKRRQSPPGPRITRRAFGKDWRLPITNRYLS